MIIIKYNKRTKAEDTDFILDINLHHQLFELVDNINPPDNYKPRGYNTKIDLNKYNGMRIFGYFDKYSIIDGFSIFLVDPEKILCYNRDIKLFNLLNK